MISYAEKEVYPAEYVALLKKATKLVDSVMEEEGEVIRCHELARAVGHVLNLPFSDGRYGNGIDHTWLRLGDWATKFHEASILDVYVPGRLPQVQLVHYGFAGWSLRDRDLYKQGVEYERHDIKQEQLSRLIWTMERVEL